MRLQRHQATGIGLLLIHIVALAAFLPMFFSWSALLAAFVLYNITALGITLCYHRTLTHRGLRLNKAAEYVGVISGALALQGGPIEWVSTHRKHHAFSDGEDDPHTMARGFLWAHCSWLFRQNAKMCSEADVRHFAPDMVDVPFYRWVDRNTLWLQIALGIGLLIAGGWSWVIWGIFARLVVCYHITWMINSVAHMIGYRSFKTTDLSTKLLVARAPVVGRRLAQQPPRVPVLGAFRTTLVRVRSDVADPARAAARSFGPRDQDSDARDARTFSESRKAEDPPYREGLRLV